MVIAEVVENGKCGSEATHLSTLALPNAAVYSGTKGDVDAIPESFEGQINNRIKTVSTTLAAYTILHVAISLIAIVSGIVVMYGMLGKQDWAVWTKLFLTTTVLTSLTGFFFPFHGFTPALGTGVISMVVLAVALYARYVRKLAGIWRKIYVAGAVSALYLNTFVLVVQLFLKIPWLKRIAPTQKDPPFVIAQLAVLVAFVVIGLLAVIRYRDDVESLPRNDPEAAGV